MEEQFKGYGADFYEAKQRKRLPKSTRAQKSKNDERVLEELK